MDIREQYEAELKQRNICALLQNGQITWEQAQALNEPIPDIQPMITKAEIARIQNVLDWIWGKTPANR